MTPLGSNKIILFVTEEKQISSTNYRDILREDILEWEGPNDQFAEERMLTAKPSGTEIHLFHRPRHHMDFTYRGELALLTVDLKKNTPSKFAFEILDASRLSWTHEQLLAAFYLYLQLKPTEIQNSFAVSEFARFVKKPESAVTAKLRTFAQLDPVIATEKIRASDNVTSLDKTVWQEFQDNWTSTTLTACEAYETVVGTYESLAATSQASAADAIYLFQEGKSEDAIVQVRRNQHVFRKAVLSSYDSTCCITGLKNSRLLIASHIVPWSEDKNNRLNPSNGLCLSALHDRAYDQGLITVLPDYKVKINHRLVDERGNDFLNDALLRYEGTSIRMPGRFRPNPEFLTRHARRFGFV